MMDRHILALTLFAAFVAAAGCKEKSAPYVKPIQAPSEKPDDQAQRQPRPSPEKTSEATQAEPPVAANPIEDPPVIGTPQEAFNFPRPPLEMPKVLLTEGETKKSLVKVGDKMPEITLPDLSGKPQQLSQLLGEKLTVVAFWNTLSPYALEEVGDLGPIIGERFRPHGVEIVGIVERSSPTAAKVALKNVGADFVNLVDANGKAFEQVASAELPRTYLLDADGKILWFDLEYSRSTRRDLVRAIQFALLNDK
jgi:peroxiredoxin